MNDRQTELKEHSAHIFEMGCMEQRVYLKNDADAVIEAKDAEIAKLKERYNDMDIAHTVHIAKMNAKIEELEDNERRLKRALWLARSYRGRDNSILLPSKFMRNVWDNVERKCLKKAEQYK